MSTPEVAPAADVTAAAGNVVAGSVVEVLVGEAVHGGWCVGRLTAAGDGPVVFVRHALPGELVKASVTQVTARLLRAEVAEVLRPSADRVAPPCPYAGPGGCGGCDWQHASLPAQRRLKGQVVEQQLRRIAGLDAPVTVEALPEPGSEPGQESGLGWRTKVRFAVGRAGEVGFYRHRSHVVVPVDRCAIAHPLVEGAGATGRLWPGAEYVEISVAPVAGDVSVDVARRPARRGPGIPGGRDAGSGPDGPIGRSRRDRPAGRLRFLTRRAAGRTWRVAPDGFWQVHPAAADVLAEAVLAALSVRPGETALDLYCGAGLFAGVLAGAVGPGGTVIGIEQDPAAVRDARANLRESPWARIHRGDAADVLSRIGLGGAGVAVLDPPRAGVSRDLITRLTGGESLRRIGYVSCDPATLARDLREFGERGWRLEGLRAFDAFPMTHHVELLASLAPATRLAARSPQQPPGGPG